VGNRVMGVGKWQIVDDGLSARGVWYIEEFKTASI
jgi:hypothetical protein